MKLIKKNKPVILCIMDGWGHSNKKKYNAVKLAKTPNFDYFLKFYQNCYLNASGENVGLPENQIGNSEVGHMNIGSGRIVLQTLPRINEAIKKKSIFKNFNLLKFAKNHNSQGTVHIIGLCSNGGVHSHKDHFIPICKFLDKLNLKVNLHLFSDGRDSSPREFEKIMYEFINLLPKNITISSLIGRYYSMDRDNRWDRIKKSFDLIIYGKGKYNFDNVYEACESAYKRGETDEFISPSIINNYKGINPKDSLIVINFRADRIRQILESLVDPKFNKFNRSNDFTPIKNVLGMTEYSKNLDKFVSSLFEKERIKDTLGEIISKSGLKQLRLAETEKYPHVTFFFNGGEENAYENEDRILVNSPLISTYDLKPEMSAELIKKKLLSSIKSEKYDLIIVNFANPDMVGHTGNLKAVVKAVETVDKTLAFIKNELDKTYGIFLLTSDHGNCEKMWDEKNNSFHTAHTTNPVPLILINSKKNTNFSNLKLRNGKLADIAPTILELLDLKVPKLMNGISLIVND